MIQHWIIFVYARYLKKIDNNLYQETICCIMFYCDSVYEQLWTVNLTYVHTCMYSICSKSMN